MTKKYPKAWEVNALSNRGEIRITVLGTANETAREAFYRDCAGTGWKFVYAEEITTEYWEAIEAEKQIA